MLASEPLHPKRADGSSADATFELDAPRLFRITYQHKAGARGSPRAVNSDYHEGLELLLHRLSLVGADLIDIRVDSSVARARPAHERRLDLPFPLRVDTTTDVAALRLDITRAQKPVARRRGPLKEGGNDQKRIVVTFELDEPLSDRELRGLLVHGSRSALGD